LKQHKLKIVVSMFKKKNFKQKKTVLVGS